MRSDIKKQKLEYEYRKRQNRKIGIIGLIICFVGVLIYFMFSYFSVEIPNPYNLVFMVFWFIFWFGARMIVFPVNREARAFLELVKAYEIMEARQQAHKHIRKASKLISGIETGKASWYHSARDASKLFAKALKLRAQPALLEGKLNQNHLEDITGALVDSNVDKLKAAVQTLEQHYPETELEEKTVMFWLRQFWESPPGRILYSLCLGYGAIIAICFIYVLSTGQNFVSFARNNPQIIILGGAIFSGVAFWKKD